VENAVLETADGVDGHAPGSVDRQIAADIQVASGRGVFLAVIGARQGVSASWQGDCIRAAACRAFSGIATGGLVFVGGYDRFTQGTKTICVDLVIEGT
jgi:hypothetical protein